jgi:hypothetical protein
MKLRLLLFLFFTITSIGFAQYIPITRDSAEWRAWYIHKFDNNIYTEYVGAFYNHLEDTLINGSTYYQFDHYSNARSPFNKDFLVREDTAARRVYVRHLDYTFMRTLPNSEYLYYDFSLNVGDTLFTGFDYNNNPVYWTVLTKDSLVIDGSKRLYLDVKINDQVNFTGNPSRTDRWIEGIGSEVEFNNPISPSINVFEASFDLVCYKNLSKGFSYETSKTPYDCNSSIKLIESEAQLKLEVYPNPVLNELKLDFNSSFSGSISLVNLAGIQVLHQQSQNAFKTKLSVESLASGIYILHINGERLSQNILVEKH